jgi:hypothetical protein
MTQGIFGNVTLLREPPSSAGLTGPYLGEGLFLSEQNRASDRPTHLNSYRQPGMGVITSLRHGITML